MKLIKQEFDEDGLIVLSRGKTEYDTPYWAYAHIPVTQLETYCAVQEDGFFALDEIGTVICWGEEETPPEDIKDQVHELYGLDDDYAQQVLTELQKSPAGRDLIATLEAHIDELQAHR